MLDTLITSKTRMKLLLKFFSNSQTRAYLRGLAEELGENTNAIRVELNRLSEAGLLNNKSEGNMIWYQANAANPFFSMLQNLVRKYMGVEDIIDTVVKNAGDIELAFIKGDYAQGIDSGTIELVLIGDNIDLEYVEKFRIRGERLARREITMTVHNADFLKEQSFKTLELDKIVVLYRKVVV